MSLSCKPVAQAMNAHIQTQEITAHNIANISTPGFKRHIALIASESVGGAESTAPAPSVTGVSIDFSQGTLTQTHNELDVAIKGRGFFTIGGPDGLRYTRNGRFQLSQNRILVTRRGDPVLSEAGEIQIPEGAETIVINRAGVVTIGDATVGRIRITTFENPEWLKEAGGCEFVGASDLTTTGEPCTLHQGFVEDSNIQPIHELVRMISSFRNYEACARSLRSVAEAAKSLYTWARA